MNEREIALQQGLRGALPPLMLHLHLGDGGDALQQHAACPNAHEALANWPKPATFVNEVG